MTDIDKLRKDIEDQLKDRPYVLEKILKLIDMVQERAHSDGHDEVYSEGYNDGYDSGYCNGNSDARDNMT